MDDDAERTEMAHGCRPVHYASSGGDNARSASQRKDMAFFQAAESLHSFPVDDLLKTSAFSGLDKDVGVQKIAGDGFGQQNPHGALADARHANEDEIRIRSHFALILSVLAEKLSLQFTEPLPFASKYILASPGISFSSRQNSR
jgi:hypothetical protein